MNKKIEVVPYNSKWPEMYDYEEKRIKQALGDNCTVIHHVGSTSVPGLAAKPKIDIVAVVKNNSDELLNLEDIGYESKGEYNIPFHQCFAKRGVDYGCNLHIYEEGNPEIELNLLFRDYLRNHPEKRNEYAILKMDLISKPSSHEKRGVRFSGYNLGKDTFIKEILKKTGFNSLCMRFCTHDDEWDAAIKFRQRYFFDLVPIADPYTWTFEHKDHLHFIFYQGTEIIGYAHIQLCKSLDAIIRIIVIEDLYRNRGFGSQFLTLCECWLKRQGVKAVYTDSRRDAKNFYLKQGYIVGPFDDPEVPERDPNDIPMGKTL
jgi:GrpB-like predicted nucleotidyltransferase (UPF0157 family)/GNAT superfamily N-acetyltransferase